MTTPLLRSLSLPQMAFGAGKVQMKFLHLLSTEASQSITLHCLNDSPYVPLYTGAVHKENTTLRFRGWNRQMFEKDTLLEPHVLQDECKVTCGTKKWMNKSFVLADSSHLQVSVTGNLYRGQSWFSGSSMMLPFFCWGNWFNILQHIAIKPYKYETYFVKCGTYITWLIFSLSSSFFCQIQDGSWHQSRFFFHTQDSRQLPIVDMQEFPTSQPSGQRHIEIGPVCFLWHQPHHRPVTYSLKLFKCKTV